ncbi:glycerol-3-phosphate 1-O-acyltransferase PlsY [Hazenella sp. IB182357]|uniref:Glycerol-3-phosphate acyltransferase n=1 Tax=Polycladospora coralii TaxID=2771432 RepID=A0A926N935_9BACL|nr:glycerol-3-phosphate 1-O-acyltransferase PlsY [Polycladospora coralii]MBD1371637.1 glycerol-3-phosphate 1-O-acyltransferase PlsY [Polycladospora coralii]MBS7529104.1 glycerol-3-phosphate 1-O-acyltransferase PlsY [Polycladospora coralii]
MLLNWIIPIILAYLCGSISFSYFMGRYRQGIDIRKHGSGNAGATNTLRVMGKGAALIVFILDVIKGMAGVGIGYLFRTDPTSLTLMLVCGIAAIIGHNWPVFLRFRGGKGIATTVGVAAILFFYAALISGVLGLIAIFISRFVSLGSLVFTVSLPFVMLVMGYEMTLILLMSVIALLAVFQHRQNLKNLINGEERKI